MTDDREEDSIDTLMDWILAVGIILVIVIFGFLLWQSLQ